MLRMRVSIERAESEGIPDAVAVERTLAGDRQVYRVLVDRYSLYIYRLAYRMTGNSHDAEEVVQEAFLRGYQKLSQFAGNRILAPGSIASPRITPSTGSASAT